MQYESYYGYQGPHVKAWCEAEERRRAAAPRSTEYLILLEALFVAMAERDIW